VCEYALNKTLIISHINGSVYGWRRSWALYPRVTRNVLLDSCSTPPNTHCPLTAWLLLYFRRPNLLSSITTVLLGQPIFSEQPSTYSKMASLQKSFTVLFSPSSHKYDIGHVKFSVPFKTYIKKFSYKIRNKSKSTIL
jgi:hypothetical protein